MSLADRVRQAHSAYGPWSISSGEAFVEALRNAVRFPHLMAQSFDGANQPDGMGQLGRRSSFLSRTSRVKLDHRHVLCRVPTPFSDPWTNPPALFSRFFAPSKSSRRAGVSALLQRKLSGLRGKKREKSLHGSRTPLMQRLRNRATTGLSQHG
jgi:hypothetical protein